MELEKVYDAQLMKLCALIESCHTVFNEKVEEDFEKPKELYKLLCDRLLILRGVLLLALEFDLIDRDEVERVYQEEEDKYTESIINIIEKKREEDQMLYGR